jgi:polyisoprenoid-binding protein YceI
MRLMTTALVFAVLAAGVRAETKYALTGDNTKIEWTGSKADGKHDGGFKILRGTALIGDAGALKFEVEIDTDSLYSDNDKLTGHLKSPDFFNVKANPKAKFVSKTVAKGDKGYTVTGDLTLCGKTRTITFPAEIATAGGLTVKGEFTINRMDFGMTYGKGMVNDAVTIRVKVDAKS